MFWIEIRSNKCRKDSDALDYVYEEDPQIDDLEWYFGNKFDMIMGPQEYTLEQKVVKSPPTKWLKESLREAERKLERYQERVKFLAKELVRKLGKGKSKSINKLVDQVIESGE